MKVNEKQRLYFDNFNLISDTVINKTDKLFLK